MPFMKYALFLPLFVYRKTEFHAETAEDCQRVCELSRSCNFWNFSKTERQTEGFDLTCQLLNSGKRVSGAEVLKIVKRYKRSKGSKRYKTTNTESVININILKIVKMFFLLHPCSRAPLFVFLNRRFLPDPRGAHSYPVFLFADFIIY